MDKKSFISLGPGCKHPSSFCLIVCDKEKSFKTLTPVSCIGAGQLYQGEGLKQGEKSTDRILFTDRC
jgi:hypothetical protein